MTTNYPKILLFAVTLSAITAGSYVMANEVDNKREHHDTPHDGKHKDSHADDHSDSHAKSINGEHGENEHKSEHIDEHGHGHDAEEGHVEISLEDAKKAGIVNALANTAQINNSFTVYGRSVIKPDAISQVSARYSGLITQLNVNVGDVVKAGDIIAEVESSKTLKHYNILASISGIVTKRHANAGELSAEKPLITIENYDKLWVEFKVFPSHQSLIARGQQVTISSTTSSVQSNVVHLLANKNQPFITAIATIDNKKDKNNKRLWSPGQMLQGSLVTSQTTVKVAVDNRAFQEVEGKNVIFIVNANGYETRELTLGITDGSFTEVLSGVNAGEQYAVVNSYLLKADLGKAGAAHVH